MHDRPRLRVVICGGGIAGLAAALLLREDHDVTVLESTDLNDELGAAITLSMNASRLLKTSLARAGFDAKNANFVEAETYQEVHWKSLSVLAERRMDHITKHYDAPWWYFSRHDLHNELKRGALSPDGLGKPVKLELATAVERVDLPTRTVHTTSGCTFSADIIIGADGIRSPSGTSIFGKLPNQTQGFSAYRCMIATKTLQSEPSTSVLVDSAKVLMFMGPSRRIVAYPCSSWEWMNFVCIFPDNIDTDTSNRQQWNTAVTVEEMIEKFQDFHPAIIKALSLASSTGVWRLRDRDPLPTLVKDCFALIGDAAHAMGPHQGQGACQAIEDAEALRIVLTGATRDTVADRLKIFDELRVERVKTIIQYTRNTAPDATGTISKEDHAKYTDYYWSYHLTKEGVRAMQEHGMSIMLVDASTGELGLGVDG